MRLGQKYRSVVEPLVAVRERELRTTLKFRRESWLCLRLDPAQRMMGDGVPGQFL